MRLFGRWTRAGAAALIVVAACSPSDSGADVTTSVPATLTTTVGTTSTLQPPPSTSAPSTTATTVPPATTSTTLPPATARLAARSVWAFPGPEHFEGDVLTFEVPIGGFEPYALVDASLSVDGREVDAEPIVSGDPLLGAYLVFPSAFDTAGQVGWSAHWSPM